MGVVFALGLPVKPLRWENSWCQIICLSSGWSDFPEKTAQFPLGRVCMAAHVLGAKQVRRLEDICHYSGYKLALNSPVFSVVVVVDEKGVCTAFCRIFLTMIMWLVCQWNVTKW